MSSYGGDSGSKQTQGLAADVTAGMLSVQKMIGHRWKSWGSDRLTSRPPRWLDTENGGNRELSSFPCLG